MAKKKSELGVASTANTDISSVLTLLDTIDGLIGGAVGDPTTPRRAQWITTELRKMRVTLKKIQSGV